MSLSKTRSRFLQRLQNRKHRERKECFVVEGVRAASAALEAGADIHFAVTSPRLEILDQNNRLMTRLADVVSKRRRWTRKTSLRSLIQLHRREFFWYAPSQQ